MHPAQLLHGLVDAAEGAVVAVAEQLGLQPVADELAGHLIDALGSLPRGAS